MNWLLASTGMFVCSVILYLLVRKSSLLKIPLQLNNLAMFGIPFLTYMLFAYITHTILQIDWYQLSVLVVMSVGFSYLGNIFSLKSIERAPNPGYSLIISKSYVVFTTIAAVLFFRASLDFRSITAIALIIIGSACITLNQKMKMIKTTDSLWLLYAFGAFFCWGLLSLASKYAESIGIDVLPRLIYLHMIVTTLILAEMKWKQTKLISLTKGQIILLFMIGILSAGFNFFMQQGITTAPNIGFINAINASSIAAVSVFSAIIFHDELTKQKLLGVIMVTLGLIILVI